MTRYVKEIEDDQRISDLLKILRERDVADNYADTKSKDNITAENLDLVNALFVSNINFQFLNSSLI